MLTLIIIFGIILIAGYYILGHFCPKFTDAHDFLHWLTMALGILFVIIGIVGGLCLGGILITEDVTVNEIANCESDIAYFEELLPDDGALVNVDDVAYRNNLFELRTRVRDLKKDLDMMDTYRWWLYFGGV